MKRFGTSATASLVSGLLLLAYGAAAQAEEYAVRDLITDDNANLTAHGYAAAGNVDPNLINPWGISHSGSSPFWVSDNNSGFTTVYNTKGAGPLLTVGIPAPGGAPGGTPTGQVFSGGGKIPGTAFTFVTEDGTIESWAGGANATIRVDNSSNPAFGDGVNGAVYKGVGLATSGGANVLLAANFRSGKLDEYSSAFGYLGSFSDSTVPAGYAPFNVQTLSNGETYVTFALQNGEKHDDVAGPGNGFVDVFDPNTGTFTRLISNGWLNSPWGLDIAPAKFGKYSGDLLVGNFGDGTIGAYNPTSGAFLGQLDGPNGQPIVIGDLWGLINGNGGAGGDPNTVYFAAGVNDEAHGLFGAISVPEPSTWAMLILGVGLVGFALRRRGAMAAA